MVIDEPVKQYSDNYLFGLSRYSRDICPGPMQGVCLSSENCSMLPPFNLSVCEAMMKTHTILFRGRLRAISPRVLGIVSTELSLDVGS